MKKRICSFVFIFLLIISVSGCTRPEETEPEKQLLFSTFNCTINLTNNATKWLAVRVHSGNGHPEYSEPMNVTSSPTTLIYNYRVNLTGLYSNPSSINIQVSLALHGWDGPVNKYTNEPWWDTINYGIEGDWIHFYTITGFNQTFNAFWNVTL